jgi:prevent-host-death family protein
MSSRVVDLKQAQSRLEELVGQAARGEEVILTWEGQPVAKIIPVMQRVAQRRFGSARGLIRMRSDFDEPLEDFRGYM